MKTGLRITALWLVSCAGFAAAQAPPSGATFAIGPAVVPGMAWTAAAVLLFIGTGALRLRRKGRNP